MAFVENSPSTSSKISIYKKGTFTFEIPILMERILEGEENIIQVTESSFMGKTIAGMVMKPGTNHMVVSLTDDSDLKIYNTSKETGGWDYVSGTHKHSLGENLTSQQMVTNDDRTRVMVKMLHTIEKEHYLRVYNLNDMEKGGLFKDFKVPDSFTLGGFFSENNLVYGYDNTAVIVYDVSSGRLIYSDSQSATATIQKIVYQPKSHIISYINSDNELIALKLQSLLPNTLSASLMNSELEKNQLQSMIQSQISRALVVGGRVVTMGVVFFSSLGGNSCLSATYGFIKMFQIIEIMGKLIYIPVYFRGQLNDILEGINQLGDPVDIPSNTLMKGSLLESHHSFRGKIYLNEEFGNILQSMPISTIVFLLLETVIFVLNIIQRPKEGIKKNKVASLDAFGKEEPTKLKWYDRARLL